MKLKLLFTASVMLLAAACQHTYKEVAITPVSERPQLSKTSVVYVAMASDAMRKDDLQIGSGAKVSQLLRDTFARYARRAYIARRVESLPDSIATAKAGKCDYVIYPTIQRWEDRATEFSGMRDKVEVKVDLAETATGSVVYSTVIQGTSRWMTDGGDQPEHLLPEPVKHYVAGLFQVLHTPSALEKR